MDTIFYKTGRKTFLLIASVAALLVATGAQADAPPSADLTVSGTIEPGACTMTTGGEIDYGNITLNTDTTKDTVLPRNNLAHALTVSCPYPVRISLSFSDNRSDSIGGNTNWTKYAEGAVWRDASNGDGLGFDSAGNKIGGYAFSVGGFQADGALYRVKVPSGSNGNVVNGWGEIVSGAEVNPAGKIATFIFAGSDGTAVVAKEYSLNLSVAANIAPASKLSLTNVIKLDGSIGVQLNYL